MEGNTHLLQVIRKMRSQINKLERENRALRGELQVCRQSAVPLEREATRGGGNSNVRTLDDDGEGAAVPPASLHGSIVPGPAPAPKEQTDTTMTVRRYSTASPAPAPSGARSHRAGKRPPSNGLPEVPGTAQLPAPPAATQLASGEEKGLEETLANCLSNSHCRKMKLFQEHVYKCSYNHICDGGYFCLKINSLEFLYTFYTFAILIMLSRFSPRGKIKAVSFLLPMDMSSYAENQGSLKSPQNQSTKQLTSITEKDM
ncbi:putative coiled-coil domain-containing protein 195 [Pluvialis apricaria]